MAEKSGKGKEGKAAAGKNEKGEKAEKPVAAEKEKGEKAEKSAGKNERHERPAKEKAPAKDKAGKKAEAVGPEPKNGFKPAGKAEAKPAVGRPGKLERALKKAAPKREAWVDYSPADVEKLVISLGSAGHNSAEIGLMLAKQYAVPSVKAITGKRVEKILADHKLIGEMPRDLLDLIKKSVALMKHMEENRKDMSAKRGYGLTVSKIRRLAKYYTREGKLPSGWRYTPETAMLLVK